MFVGLGIPVQSSTQEPDVCLVVFVVGRLVHFCLHKSLSVNLIVSVLFFPLGIYCLRKKKKAKPKPLSQNGACIMAYLHTLEIF